MPKLLFVCHCPSENTARLRDAVVEGVRRPEWSAVGLETLAPLDAGPADVLGADALLLGATENFGGMAGRVKDFFERVYYPCLEEKQGLPFAMYIRAGHDGAGARLGIERIVTGLKWNTVQAPLICRGDFRPEFVARCRELGMAMAAGLDAGVY